MQKKENMQKKKARIGAAIGPLLLLAAARPARPKRQAQRIEDIGPNKDP